MDRVEFELLDEGYQEDRQRLIDAASNEITPEFDQRLQNAHASYMERLRIINNAHYSFAERQQLLEQEEVNYQTNLTSIEQEKEDRINDAIFKDDQRLQELIFGEDGRDEAERRMLEFEAAMREREQRENENRAPEENLDNPNEQVNLNFDEFHNEQIEEDLDDESLLSEFNSKSGLEPPPHTPENDGVEH